MLSTKKRSGQSRPWGSQKHRLAKRSSSPVNSGGYTSSTIPDDATVIIRTEKSALWVIPDFAHHHVTDFACLRLVSRPPVKLRGGKIGHAHRDAVYHTISDMCELAADTSTVQASAAVTAPQRHSIYASVDGRMSWDSISSAMDDQYLDISRESYKSLLNVYAKVQAKFVDYEFTDCYVNFYRDGSDYIGAHSDKEIDSGGIVAGIAFGAARTFRIRDASTNEQVVDIVHKPGTLLVMEGDFQAEFKHEVPPQKSILKPRISFTFRRHETTSTK